MNEKNNLKPFDTLGDETAVAQKWDRWIRSFELFIEANAIQSDKRKKALLLHQAGETVQEIWYTLPEADEEAMPNVDVYEICKKSLSKFFKPKCNYTYERHRFRSLKQKEDESVVQYVTRLKTQSRNCNFKTHSDEMIIDQLIEKCTSSELRRQLLKEGDTLTVERAQEIGRLLESTEKQAGNIEAETKNQTSSQEIRKLEQVRNKYKKYPKPFRCYRCDEEGHKASDAKCPAKKKKCSKCGIIGHYEKCCKTKTAKQYKKVRNMDSEERNSDPDEYTFQMQDRDDPEHINAWVGGVKTKFLIDSGSTCNVLDNRNWEALKKKNIKGTCQKTNKNIYTYSSKKSLPILGTFVTSIKLENGKILEDIDFHVIKGNGIPILGKDTARKLGILKLGLPLRSIKDSPNNERYWIDKYPELFTDKIGKLKNYQIKLSIDSKIRPAVQPTRRVPYQMRGKIREKLQELTRDDIIEKVNEPSKWVSPVVYTVKKTNEIRMCVDMRVANEAIIRERHPIPSVNELIINLNGSEWFTEIDMKSAFHQIELNEESREVTTFSTSEGLYRFKRLFFGINCAPEIFQRLMEQNTAGLQGVEVYIDNFLVHGKTKKEHDKNLENLLEKLQKSGLTLNEGKCKFAQNKIQFMGHEISKDGIKPLKDRVESINKWRPPRNKNELQSFLGLIGFCSRFIPEYSNKTEILRRLLRKDNHYKWGKEHQRAFEELKMTLCKPKTLGFFDPNAKSTIIADASPYALGAVLIQNQDNGKKIIEFASKALTETEKKYSQTEKEALGIVWACERFHFYVYGTEFDLITDHKPLEFIFSPRSKPCPRLERWIMRIGGYRFKVIYQPGKQNIADPLSRLAIEDETVTDVDQGNRHVRWVAAQSTPRSMNLEDIRQKYEEDISIKELRSAICEDKWPVKFRKYEIIKVELCVIDGIILRGTRILIPVSLREQTLKLAHEGHPGIVKMKQRLRSKVWWVGLDKDVELYCKKCHGCQLVGALEPPEPLKMTRLPDAPWKHIAMDFLGPLDNDTYLFVVIDYYSRFYETKFMKTITASRTIQELKEIFTRYGLPELITADNGRQFTSEEFRDFCLESGIQLRLNTPKWPQANGEVERQNRSILKRLRIARASGNNLQDALREYIFAYHTTPHCTTGKTPAFLMFGRELRDKLPSFHKNDTPPHDIEVRDKDEEMKGKNKELADEARKSKDRELNIGDQVLLKRDNMNDKLQTPFHPTPHKIIETKGNRVTVESPEGKKLNRNSTCVKKYETEEEQKPEESPEAVQDNIEIEAESRRSYRNVRQPKWMTDYVQK